MIPILIAEDDAVSRKLLEHVLRSWDFDVRAVSDGAAAWEALRADGAPRLAIFDWMMPGLDGPEICRRVRALPGFDPSYLILLTARTEKGDIVKGLNSGADDYVTKPFDPEELHARLRVGVRMLDLQRTLMCRVEQLEAADRQLKQLQHLLPFCSHCHRVRDDYEYWQAVRAYMSTHAHLHLDHAICPRCYTSTVQPELDQMWGVLQAGV